MDPITRDEALARVRQLALPSIVLDAFEGRPISGVLQHFIESPRAIFEKSQSDLPAGRIIPLFAFNSRLSIICLREEGEPLGFMRLDLFRRTHVAEGQSWAQLLTPILVSLWRLNAHSDNVLREAAAHLAFPFAGELLAAVEGSRASPNWEGAFHATLPPFRHGAPLVT